MSATVSYPDEVKSLFFPLLQVFFPLVLSRQVVADESQLGHGVSGSDLFFFEQQSRQVLFLSPRFPPEGKLLLQNLICAIPTVDRRFLRPAVQIG